jgi:hypothetical protein
MAFNLEDKTGVDKEIGDNIHEGENDVELVGTTRQASVVGDRDVQVTKLEQETRPAMTWRNQGNRSRGTDGIAL